MTDHSNDPERLSASEAARAIREGRLTVVELAEACLARCSSRPEVVAWAHLNASLVREEAHRLDAIPMSERTSPLFGVPIGIKDIFATKDMPTEYGSKRYEGHQIGEDARIVKLLRAKGCLIFGKTHCTEFACGPGHPVHPPTRNPHDIKRSPGASSSGSAAAVADYEVTLAIGTQTGGSIIVPASFCGIYAWKPTLNLLSLGGAFSVAPSLDTLGFFSRSVDDLMMLAELFEIKTLPVKEPLHKPRIAWVPTSVDVPADEDALQVMEAAVAALQRAGFEMKKVTLPPVFDGGHKVAQTIFLKECVASFQAELAEGTDGITEGNLEMVEMGKAISWEEYTGAREAIGHAREAFLGILDDGYDALLTLSTTGEAPVADYAAGVPVYASIWTAIGVPVINLPGWGGSASMPIGLSLIGREHEDRALLEHARAVGSVFERDGNWRNKL